MTEIADKVKQIPLLPTTEPSITSSRQELDLLLRQLRILADNIVNRSHLITEMPGNVITDASHTGAPHTS